MQFYAINIRIKNMQRGSHSNTQKQLGCTHEARSQGGAEPCRARSVRKPRRLESQSQQTANLPATGPQDPGLG